MMIDARSSVATPPPEEAPQVVLPVVRMNAVVQTTSAVDDSFKDALQTLQALHDDKVAALATENARLRSALQLVRRSSVEFDVVSALPTEEPNQEVGHISSAHHRDLDDLAEEKFDLRTTWLTRNELSQNRGSKMAQTWATESNIPAASNRMDAMTRWIIPPTSPFRLVWDVAGMALVFYDVAMIPMSVFDLSDNWFLIGMNWLTLMFWSCDIVASFLTGFFHDGSTVMAPREIALRYIKTWLFPDLGIVAFDWIFNVLLASTSAGSAGTGDFGRLLRILRLARIARLIRLLKLKRVIMALQDNINSDYFTIILEFGKLVVALLILSHVLACAWYFAGKTAPSGQDSWIKQHLEDDASLDYRYATSLHWSLSYLALETIDINPQNSGERSFAIIITFFGLIVSSSMVSRITSLMVRLQTMKTDMTKQFWLLRRYLREHNVPQKLAVRIRRYLEYACEEREAHVQEDKLEVLSLLSSQLRDELRAAINEQYMSAHPFFIYLSQESNVTMHRLCSVALSSKPLAMEDPLFFHGEEATHMYFVNRGRIRYIRMQDEVAVMAEKGSCLCEAVLWVNWYHRGDALATSESEVLTLEASMFGEVMRSNPKVQALAADYAAFFIHGLNSATNLISDLMPREDAHYRFEHFLQVNNMEGAKAFAKKHKWRTASSLSSRTHGPPTPGIGIARSPEVARTPEIAHSTSEFSVAYQDSLVGNRPISPPGAPSK